LRRRSRALRRQRCPGVLRSCQAVPADDADGTVGAATDASDLADGSTTTLARHGEPPGFAGLRKAGYEVYFVRSGDEGADLKSNRTEKGELANGEKKDSHGNHQNGALLTNSGSAQASDEGGENLESEADARARKEFERWQEAAVKDGPALFPEAEQGWEKLLEWKQVSSVGPGFHNLGNTCFLNSVLQCLTYLPGLAQLATEDADDRISLLKIGKQAKLGAQQLGRLDRYCALTVLTQHMRAMHMLTQQQSALKKPKKRQAAASPDFFVRNLRKLSKHMRVGRQQDAHEFLRVLLSNMQESCALAAGMKEQSMDRRLETSAVMRLFGGVLESRLTCGRQSCGADTLTFEPYMDLSLDVVHPRIKTVEDALRRYMANERLDQENQWTCPVCHKPSTATKRLGLRKTPNQLVLQFKRFGFGARGRKVRKPVAFERELNMEKFVLGANPETSHENFALCGVVVHVGHSVTSGHYISFIRASNGLWYQMDDDVVRQVSFATVQSQPAYLLFYSRQISKSSNKQDHSSNGAAAIAGTAIAATANGSTTSAMDMEDDDMGTVVQRKDVSAQEEGGGLASFAAAFASAHQSDTAVPSSNEETIRSDLFGSFLTSNEGEMKQDATDSFATTTELNETDEARSSKSSLPGFLSHCYLKIPMRTNRAARQEFLNKHLATSVEQGKLRLQRSESKEAEPQPEAEDDQQKSGISSSSDNEEDGDEQEGVSSIPVLSSSYSSTNTSVVEEKSDTQVASTINTPGGENKTSLPNHMDEVKPRKTPSTQPVRRRSAAAGDEVVVLERFGLHSQRSKTKGSKDAWAAKVNVKSKELRKSMSQKRKVSSYSDWDAALDRGRQKKVKMAESMSPAGHKKPKGNAFQKVQTAKQREKNKNRKAAFGSSSSSVSKSNNRNNSKPGFSKKK